MGRSGKKVPRRRYSTCKGPEVGISEVSVVLSGGQWWQGERYLRKKSGNEGGRGV